MWVAFLLVLSLLFLLTPAYAEQGFDPKYQRDHNIFNPINQYRPDNPLNPINAYDPKNPFNSINRFDPGNPTNPINQFNPNNPFNPINQYNPNNPLNPINEYNPATPFQPLNRSRQHADLGKASRPSLFLTPVNVTSGGLLRRGLLYLHARRSWL